MERVHLLSYPQSTQRVSGPDSFAKVMPKSTGPLHYDDIDVTEGQQMRSDAPNGAYTFIPGEAKDRAPKTKLETATGSAMNTPTVPSEGFPGIQGF